MTWNWQQTDWPRFRYKEEALKGFEEAFLKNSGVNLGMEKHLNEEDRMRLVVDVLGDEALKTSEIEGEYLNRESVQASIKKTFGLSTDKRRVPLAEEGIGEMMHDLYERFKEPLSHKMMHEWHGMLMKGRRDLKVIGGYRTHEEPMQIVSGAIHEPKVHYEAPPSKVVKKEMNGFVKWFNKTESTGGSPLPALTRAGIAHLYFISIHPYEDGNGRIGRAVAEKVLSQSMGEPTLIALSHRIQDRKKDYYQELAGHSKGNEITGWLVYFAKTVLKAQVYTQRMIGFLVSKTKFFDRFRGELNERQEKVIGRIFSEGIEGFEGGLRAEKYRRITKTSKATATRDLADLVKKGAMEKAGELKGARYRLRLEP